MSIHWNPDTIENLKASRYESAVLRMAEKKLEIMKLVLEQRPLDE